MRPVPSALTIDPRDDVAVALAPISAGDPVAANITAAADIPPGHKVALRAIAKGDPVRKYGWPIGHALADIAPGDHVHSHNLATSLSGLEDYEYAPAAPEPMAPPTAATFMGYRRANGRVGTRNEIWILCTVGCVARTAQKIAAEADRRFKGRVDGVYALTHPFGCSQLGGDLAATRTMIGTLAAHPNAGGALILGLGCESNQLDALLAAAPDIAPDRLRAFTAQSTEDEVEAGLAAVEALVAVAERDARVPCPVSDLVVGLKCGGSDGFSGLTANPLVGRIADAVSGAGGTAILTEIPEIFGAEQLLMARAANEAVFGDIVSVVNDFKSYFLSHGEPVSENPSPGNIEGGVTTLEEKSLGAVQKAGRGSGDPGPALRRTDRPARRDPPGGPRQRRGVVRGADGGGGFGDPLHPPERGTPLGFGPNAQARHQLRGWRSASHLHWIDFDAGRVATGQSLDDAAEALMGLVLATASGQPTRAEDNGEREIALWKRGVTL